MQTKETLTTDYIDLMKRIEQELETLDVDSSRNAAGLTGEALEKKRMLEEYHTRLEAKFDQMQSTAEGSLSHIIFSVHSTYLDAKLKLNDWLRDGATRN